MEQDKLSRRDFLKQSSLALGGLVANALGSVSAAGAGAAAPRMDRSHNYNEKMGYRRLGKTNIMISEIGLGGHGETDLKNREEVLAHAAELGLNYLDTNMVSECELYGQALKGMRGRWYIGFACWPFKLTEPDKVDTKVMMGNIENALKNYRADMLDIWRPVGASQQSDTTAVLQDRVLDAVVEVFEKARKQGKVRWLGISAHNPANIWHILRKYPSFSVILFPYFFLAKERVGRSLVSLAREKDVGIIAIKPFGGGLMFRAFREWAYGEPQKDATIMLRRILANRGVASAIPGVANAAQLEINVRASHERADVLSPSEEWALRKWEKRFFSSLRPEYAWFKEWEYV